DRRLAGGVADDDADDVRAAAARAGARAPRPALPRERARLRLDSSRLRALAVLGVAPPAAGAGDYAADDGRHGFSLRQSSERLLSAAGHRPHQRIDPGRPGHLFSRDARTD